MASLTLQGGVDGFRWYITGLGNNFTTLNGYVLAGITKDQFTVGGTTSISGVVSSVAASLNGTTSVTSWCNYAPGTYQFWGFTLTKLGGYWPAGTATVTVRSSTAFEWSFAGLDERGVPVVGQEKLKGLGVYVTADEWNELVRLVNIARNTAIPSVARGDIITATVVNPVADALSISGVSRNDTLTAAFFNNLKNAYNSIL